MKTIQVLCLTVACLSGSTWAGSQPINQNSALSDQAGYSLGYIVAKNNVEAIKNMNLDAFIEGLKVAVNRETPSLSEEAMTKALETYKSEAESQDLVKLQKLGTKNAQLGEHFLKQNLQNKAIVKTPSGLQYQILKQGQGITPQTNSTVTLNYEGRLLDQTVFDSSIARQQPVTLKLNEMIKGLNEGIQLMKEGEKVRFFIPAQLAYGEIGSGDVIEPNSTLIFDVELMKVEK